MTESEYFKPLHAVAEDLAAKGAPPSSIVAALVDVALKIAERDPYLCSGPTWKSSPTP
jgi:hypothetical protein